MFLFKKIIFQIITIILYIEIYIRRKVLIGEENLNTPLRVHKIIIIMISYVCDDRKNTFRKYFILYIDEAYMGRLRRWCARVCVYCIRVAGATFSGGQGGGGDYTLGIRGMCDGGAARAFRKNRRVSPNNTTVPPPFLLRSSLSGPRSYYIDRNLPGRPRCRASVRICACEQDISCQRAPPPSQPLVPSTTPDCLYIYIYIADRPSVASSRDIF